MSYICNWANLLFGNVNIIAETWFISKKDVCWLKYWHFSWNMLLIKCLDLLIMHLTYYCNFFFTISCVVWQWALCYQIGYIHFIIVTYVCYKWATLPLLPYLNWCDRCYYCVCSVRVFVHGLFYVKHDCKSGSYL